MFFKFGTMNFHEYLTPIAEIKKLLTTKELFIFDLDGTLFNTLGDLAPAVNYALKQFGVREISKENVRSCIGNGSKNLIRRSVASGLMFAAGKTAGEPIAGKSSNAGKNYAASKDRDANINCAEGTKSRNPDCRKIEHLDVRDNEAVTAVLENAGFDDAKIGEVHKVYSAYYWEHSTENTEPYEGVIEIIRRINAAGCDEIADAGCRAIEDAKCSTSAETRCNGIADAGCDEIADAGCRAIADAKCSTSAETRCGEIADAGCRAIADAKCSTSAETRCRAIADAGCGTSAETRCGEIADAGCRAIADAKCSTSAETRCNGIADAGCGEIANARCAAKKIAAMLTNKPVNPAKKILEKFGLIGNSENCGTTADENRDATAANAADKSNSTGKCRPANLISAYLCGDTTPERKPSPAGIFALLQQTGVAPEKAVMIGDDMPDVLAAKNAGIDCITLLEGFGRPENLLPLAPKYTAGHIKDFAELITPSKDTFQQR